MRDHACVAHRCYNEVVFNKKEWERSLPHAIQAVTWAAHGGTAHTVHLPLRVGALLRPLSVMRPCTYVCGAGRPHPFPCRTCRTGGGAQQRLAAPLRPDADPFRAQDAQRLHRLVWAGSSAAHRARPHRAPPPRTACGTGCSTPSLATSASCSACHTCGVAVHRLEEASVPLLQFASHGCSNESVPNIGLVWEVAKERTGGLQPCTAEQVAARSRAPFREFPKSWGGI